MLLEGELEFIKVFVLGVFLGYQLRKYFYGIERNVPWTSIKNIRFNFLNIIHNKKIPFDLEYFKRFNLDHLRKMK